MPLPQKIFRISSVIEFMNQRRRPQRDFSQHEWAFIREHTKLRMGQFYEPNVRAHASHIKEIDLDALRDAIWRPLVIFKKDETGLNVIFELKKNPRNEEFMEYIKNTSRKYNTYYVADFGDRIPSIYEPFQRYCIPIFSKSRPIDSCFNVILWTHGPYRIFRENGIAGYCGNVPWKEKIPEIIWRGCPHGSLLMPNGTRIGPGEIFRRFTQKNDANLNPIIGNYGNGGFKDIVDENLIRFKAVSRYADRFDIRFVDVSYPVDENYTNHLKRNYKFGDKINIEQLVQYKYHLVLEGNDAGTQINWALSSKSVILMPPRQFHSTTTLGLREWTHYVPVRQDLSDLEERLDWCRCHDDECRAIAENAMAYAANFRSPVEDEIGRCVIAKYNGEPLPDTVTGF